MLASRKEHIQALVGRTVAGKYRIERLLGAGGMGAVYEAVNLSINKRVALKFLFRDDALDSDTVTRFQREAEAASAIASEHIVQVFDAGSDDDGRPYLVMELLDGEDLRHRLKREGKLALPVVAEIAEQLLLALGKAHGSGIVHRDLKPDNIYVCRRDDQSLFVKIVDFGISKIINENINTLTREGTVLGTAHYMAPEQAQALPDIDGRADLFSLGAILYEALAGRPPHLGRTYEAVLILACTKPAPDIRVFAPEVPDAVAAVIAKSIARDRNDRFGTAQEFANALREALGSMVTAPDSLSVRTSPRSSAVDSALADTERLGGVDESPEGGQSPSEDSPSAPKGLAPTRTMGATAARRPSPPGRLVLGAAAMLAILGIAVLGLTVRPEAAPPLRPSPSARESHATPMVPVPPPPSESAPTASAPPPRASAAATTVARVQKVSPPERPALSKSAVSPTPVSSQSPLSDTGAPPTASSGVAGQLKLKTEGP